MRFEERELQPYAEPVSPTELQKGTVYFALTYTPEDMTIPLMTTLMFVGRDLEPDDVGELYFRELKSYELGLRYDDEAGNDKNDRDSIQESELKDIFDYEHALDGVMWCSLRRRKLHKQSPMHWEGRELSPDAQPVLPADLQEGSVYFAINYADEDRLIPVMNTLVFIGRNLEPGDTSKLYFQDIYSHGEGFQFNSADKPDWATFYVETERELMHTFEFERALEELMRCSLGRRKG